MILEGVGTSLKSNYIKIFVSKACKGRKGHLVSLPFLGLQHSFLFKMECLSSAYPAQVLRDASQYYYVIYCSIKVVVSSWNVYFVRVGYDEFERKLANKTALTLVTTKTSYVLKPFGI